MDSVDFVLPGVARVRLLNATPADTAVVQRQLGNLHAAVAGTADLTIRFVRAIPEQPDLRILGNWEAGYTRDTFWILRGVHGFPIALQLPMESLGEPCELLCRSPLPAVPLLGSLLNLIALAKGILPLHASAFLYGGHSVLVTGWTKGGKTEALLGFAEQGATYVGDEWIYIDPESNTMRGIPQPIHLWDWHLDSMRYRACLTATQRLKLAGLQQLQQCLQKWADWKNPLTKAAQRFGQWIQKHRHVRATPQELFHQRIQAVAECPRRVFLMGSHASSAIEVVPVATDEILARMKVSLEEEFSSLLACYRQFRFAFPDKNNPYLEQLPSLVQRRLSAALQDRDGMAVWHPYPVSPRLLFRAMSGHVAVGKRVPARQPSEPVGAMSS